MITYDVAEGEPKPNLCISKTTCMADNGYGFCNDVSSCTKCVTECPGGKVVSTVDAFNKGYCVAKADCINEGLAVYTDENTCITKAACAEKNLLVGHSGTDKSGECFTRETCASNNWMVS